MAYPLSIYTHRSTGKDGAAAAQMAGVIFGEDWKAPASPTGDDDDESNGGTLDSSAA